MSQHVDRSRASEPISHRVMSDARNRALWALLGDDGATDGLVLVDVGCGTTTPLREFVAARPDHRRSVMVVGVDHDPQPTDGHEEAPAVVRADALALPLRDGAVDLVSCFTLFSSIPTAAARRAAAAEITRVLRPGGAIVWYDLRYPSPRNAAVTAIPRRRLRRLFPDCTIESRTVSVLPPVSRRVVPLLPASYPLLVRIPFLRTHLAAVVRTPS